MSPNGNETVGNMSPKGNENSGSIIDLLYIYYMYKSEGRLKPKSGILEIPWLNLGLYIYIYIE